MEEKLGIDLVKSLAKAVINAVEEGQEAMADGKFQLTEIMGFLDNGVALVGLYNKKDQILAQLKDVDSDERAELFTYLKSEYDAPTDRGELVVDKVIDILEKGFEVYEQGVMDLVIKVKDLIALLKEK